MIRRKYRDGTSTIGLLICAAVLFLFGDSPAQQQRPSFSHALQSSGNRHNLPGVLPDTVRLLAVMVEFQEDTEVRTSGTGKFGTIYPFDYGAEILDPLPHNRAYFQSHLLFLENYVRKASGGRTNISTEVLDGVVTVSSPIRSYSFLNNQPQKPVADLAVEAWTIADGKFPSVDFSGYDMFVLFHAGRGRDVDLVSLQGVDPTPFDIPSLSFTLHAFRKHYGSNYAGIPVENGSFHITNCSVIPTTNNREIPLITGETGLLELTINGLLAASFGTYAGLPDLFDTEKGRTGIGRFGLMDGEAIFAYGGICPPEPSAWEKQALGWAIPQEASAGKHQYFLTAHRTDQPSTPAALRVPITSREYWLLENRQRDPGGNGQRITMLTGGQEFELRFPKDTSGFENGSVAALKGIVIDVEDLDWSLPGGLVSSENSEVRVNGGILIWHIDETIIDAHMADNTVNADPDRRGVDLEQAAGPQDIGETIETIFGSSVGSGSPLDYWFRENISLLYRNRFDATTTPHTRSNNSSRTHVTIDDFDIAGPVMSVDVAVGDNTLAPVNGFPVDLAGRIGANTGVPFIQTADIDGDAVHELFVAAVPETRSGSDTALVFGIRQDGSAVLVSSVDLIVARLHGVSALTGAPLFGDVDGDGKPEMVVAGRSSSGDFLYILKTRDDNNDGEFDLLSRIEASSGAGEEQVPYPSILFSNGELVYAYHSASSDSVVAIGKTRSSFVLPRTASSAGYVPYTIGEAGNANYIVTSGNFISPVFDAGNGSAPTYSDYGMTVNHLLEPAVAPCLSTDLDGDSFPESVRISGGKLQVISQSTDPSIPGLPQNLPLSISLHSSTPFLAAGDGDGDGRNDLIIADGDRTVLLNFALATVDYYPSNLGSRFALSANLGQKQDAIFIVGKEKLSQLGTRAMQADGFPIPLPADADVVLLPIGASDPTLGIAAAGSDGLLYLYSTSSRIPADGLVWRSRYADERNTKFTAGKGTAVRPVREFFPPERCYNWPNPVYDPFTSIRFYVDEPSTVTIKIYDLAGEKVDELVTSAAGGTDNEVKWNVSSIESGVYIAHVKAEAAGNSGERMIKIAVVK